MRTCNDLIWLLQHDASSDCITLSRCLHPMEGCTLQGFRAEQLAGMSKAGVLRATGNAMSAPVVAAAFKRCMAVLAARSSMGVPSTIPPPDEERQRRRIAIKLMQEHIALLEAQESALRQMRQQG